MPSTYTTNGGIELIATGEQSGTWGDTTNENLEIIDRLTNGVGTITLSGTTHTLTTSNGALSDGQYAVLVFAGSPSGTNTVTITPNTNQHVYIVRNTTAQSVVLTQGSGGDVTIATNKSAIVYANGSGAGAAVVEITSTFNFATLDGDTDSATPFETSLGSGAGVVNTGLYNTFIGFEAGNDNSTGANNTAVGYRALDVNTNASANTAVGSEALGANSTGSFNTAVGALSLDSNSTGTRNTALGYDSLGLNTSDDNTGLGYGALKSNTSGTDSTAVGSYALFTAATANNNTAVGYSSLGVATASNNTAVGFESGAQVSTGTQNTLIGDSAGSSGTNDLTTGSNNTIIGYNAAASSATVSNEITLGNASVTKLRVPGISINWDADSVAFRNIPQNSKSAAYDLLASDAGKHIFHPSADTTARTFTIPANGTVPFPIGTAVTFINQNGAGVVTIAINTDTMRLAGTGTTGNRTLAANGVATAIKVTSTEWIISGVGLT
jgi:hypothetical protein